MITIYDEDWLDHPDILFGENTEKDKMEHQRKGDEKYSPHLPRKAEEKSPKEKATSTLKEEQSSHFDSYTEAPDNEPITE